MSNEVPKALKMGVISMGVVLVCGFLWVVGVVISRAGDAAVEHATPKGQVSECREVKIPAPAGANLRWEDGEWHVMTAKGVERYTACGELIQKAILAR